MLPAKSPVSQQTSPLPPLGASTPSAEPAHTSPTKFQHKSAYMVEAPGPELVYVLGGSRRSEAKDAESNIFGGRAQNYYENKMGFDDVYSLRFRDEDTRDHFGHGMNMAEENDTMNAYDRVYDSRFVNKDTEDHFDGMTMGRDMVAIALEEKRAARLKRYLDAKEALGDIGVPQHAHMGHEQLDGATSFENNSMNLIEDADLGNAFDRVYDTRFEHKHSEDNFEDLTMRLAPTADAGNTFDNVFGTAFDGAVAHSHFIPGTFNIGPPGLSEQAVTRHYPRLTKEQMFPPPRPKFLHGMPGTGQSSSRIDPRLEEKARRIKQLSKEMQAEMEAVKFKSRAGFVPVGSAGAQATAGGADEAVS